MGRASANYLKWKSTANFSSHQATEMTGTRPAFLLKQPLGILLPWSLLGSSMSAYQLQS